MMFLLLTLTKLIVGLLKTKYLMLENASYLIVDRTLLAVHLTCCVLYCGCVWEYFLDAYFKFELVFDNFFLKNHI